MSPEVAGFGVICLVVGYLLGFRERTLWAEIKSLRGQLTARREDTDKPKSAILEPPLTPAERVAREQEELLERLNRQ